MSLSCYSIQATFRDRKRKIGNDHFARHDYARASTNYQRYVRKCHVSIRFVLFFPIRTYIKSKIYHCLKFYILSQINPLKIYSINGVILCVPRSTLKLMLVSILCFSYSACLCCVIIY